MRALMVKSRTSIRTRSISLGLKIHMKCLESFTKCRLISCSGPEEFSNWCRSGLGEPWHGSRVTWWERFWTRIGQRMGGLLEIPMRKQNLLMNLLAPTSPCWESPASSCLGCWGGLGGFRSLHDKFNYKYHLNDESLLKNWFRFTQQTLWPFHWSLRCPFSSQLNTSDAWKKTLQQNRSKLWIPIEFMFFWHSFLITNALPLEVGQIPLGWETENLPEEWRLTVHSSI